MPSLQNLDAFADRFLSVGGEARVLAERGEEPDVPALPDREPEPLPLDNDLAGLLDEDVPAPVTKEPPKDIAPDKEAPPEPLAEQDDLDTPEPDNLGGSELDLPADDEGAGIMPDFDFGDFARPTDEDLAPLSIDDALPQEFNDSNEPREEPAESNEYEDTAPAPEYPDLDNFDNLLEDTASDAENAAPDIEKSVPDTIDAETVETLSPADREDLEELEELEPEEDVSAPDIPDGSAVQEQQEGLTGLGADALEDLPSIEEELAVVDEPFASSLVSFDKFDLAGSDAATPDKTASSEFPDLDEFALPGIDVSAEGASAAEPAAQAEPGKDTGDINLTEEEFAQLEETLQDYPLNLRVACEEAIAQAATPSAQVSQLVKLLVRGGAARDAAKLAGKILDKHIVIPRGYQKRTGAELEAEQARFGYIFVKKFLPLLGLFLFIAGAIAGTVYLGWNFVYKPLKADSLYKIGIERIAAGEYERASERFNEAWRWKPVKKWFYTYAEAFRDARQYFYAEEKYEQLIAYTAMRNALRNKRGVPEEQGVLDYARMETEYLRDYEKADRIIRTHILDWNPDDSEGLLALGDVNMAWGDSNVEFSDEGEKNRDGGKYEVARQNYARHLQLYGWNNPVLERLLIYFIRADDLSEVLPLQEYFMSQKKLPVRPATLTELGAYLLDKQTEETRFVRDANIEKIEGVRDILLRSAEADPVLPETHYHLARYYAMLGERNREQQYLDNASRLFDGAREESARRIRARIDSEQRLSHLIRDRREFFAAEERLVKAANLYEDAVERRIFRPSSRFGSIYADLGDLAYFTKFSGTSLPGNWQEAITCYLRAEESGYSTTEMQYRLGASYYHLSDFRRAEERFFQVSTETPPNRRVLHALGNTSFLRGNFSAAESYFSKLVSMLQAGRLSITDLRMDDDAEHRDLVERLMIAQNNLGAVYQTLAERDGSNRYRTRALALYSEASRIWDNVSRDRETFVRPGLADLSIPTVSLPYLNTANTLYPVPAAKPEIFIDIDRDMLESSPWDYLSASQ
ncbi:MAG: tetratricopeptide repeat protein [Spirochaetaceae bacterium]|jgi:tetratricopeptide (TPR) repeat protein|nr:tetratricopeptide repeat protein [Spirochaetaceae bacterium]